jgi:hypothetical protein
LERVGAGDDLLAVLDPIAIRVGAGWVGAAHIHFVAIREPVIVGVLDSGKAVVDAFLDSVDQSVTVLVSHRGADFIAVGQPVVVAVYLITDGAYRPLDGVLESVSVGVSDRRIAVSGFESIENSIAVGVRIGWVGAQRDLIVIRQEIAVAVDRGSVITR